MTFRTAILIHKRHQQPRRRIVPAFTLAAAALVAAALFLGISNSTRAEEPPKSSNDCTGLPVLAVVTANTGIASASRTTSSGNCNFSIEVRRTTLPTPHDGSTRGSVEPCVVTAMPSALGSRGARVAITYQDNCDGVDIDWRITVAAVSQFHAVGGSGIVEQSAQSGSWTTAHAFLLGEDVFDIDMYKNRSEASWRHTSDAILEHQHYPSSWGTTHELTINLGHPPLGIAIYLGDGWTVEYKTSGVQYVQVNRGKAWNHVNFHAHLPVLPDPRARTKSVLWIEPGGGFACDFSNQVTNNYVFGLKSECAEGRSPS